MCIFLIKKEDDSSDRIYIIRWQLLRDKVEYSFIMMQFDVLTESNLVYLLSHYLKLTLKKYKSEKKYS